MKCIDYWPEDGRPYVALGKVLSKQSKVAEARATYAKGSQATQGENPYIWQVCVLFLVCYNEIAISVQCFKFFFFSFCLENQVAKQSTDDEYLWFLYLMCDLEF